MRKKAAGAISEDIEAACEEYVPSLATDIVGGVSTTCQDLGSGGTEGVLLLVPPQVGDTVLVEQGVVDGGQWEVEEVGRGLANYSSAQVDKVNDLNRCVRHPLASFPLVYQCLPFRVVGICRYGVRG